MTYLLYNSGNKIGEIKKPASIENKNLQAIILSENREEIGETTKNTIYAPQNRNWKPCLSKLPVTVEHRRFELLTPTLPVLCATNCANAPRTDSSIAQDKSFVKGEN